MRWGPVLVCMSLACAPAAALAADTYVVESKSLRCVLQHFETYLSAADDPVMIVLDACPELLDANALLAGKTKNYLPSFKKEDGAAAQLDRVIVYSKSDLRCLQNRPKGDMEGSAKTVEIPAYPCQRE